VTNNRPGANPDLNPASIQYSVVAPSATPALGEPLAISVGRKGGAVPLFDTTGHRCAAGLKPQLLPGQQPATDSSEVPP
jgi:hypothetical protein